MIRRHRHVICIHLRVYCIYYNSILFTICFDLLCVKTSVPVRYLLYLLKLSSKLCTYFLTSFSSRAYLVFTHCNNMVRAVYRCCVEGCSSMGEYFSVNKFTCQVEYSNSTLMIFSILCRKRTMY